jgi:hypothetical protein
LSRSQDDADDIDLVLIPSRRIEWENECGVEPQIFWKDVIKFELKVSDRIRLRFGGDCGGTDGGGFDLR